MGFAYIISEDYTRATENFQEAKWLFANLGLMEDVKKQDDFLELIKEVQSTDGEWETQIRS